MTTESIQAHEAATDVAPVWRPSPEYISGSHVERLIRALGIDLDVRNPEPAYDALYRRSITSPDEFWRKTFELFGVEWFQPFTQVADTSAGIQFPKWFVGGKLNLSHNAVFRHLRGALRDRTAIIWEGEDGAVVRLTYAELAQRIARAANALRRLGVGKGDRVGLFMPMIPETAIAALAVAHIGAIFVPIFSGYGAEAAAVRLTDSRAKVLITADAFYRRGQTVALEAFARNAAQIAGTVEKIIVVRRMGARTDADARVAYWDEIVAAESDTCAPEPMESMDPFMLIYTSGTTGRPKGTVHYHAGFPLKGAQDMAHLFDLREGEVMFWFTDMGWMMGPWLILGALTLGATALMYEGAPDYPDPGRIWSLVERHKVTHLGISPTLVRALIPSGTEPVRGHDLSSLRVLGSTGEVWNPEAYMWLLNAWPGMTNGFWQDPQRYIDTYWSRFDNVWVHGDWAMRDGDGHWYLLGRSDDTLKIAGKRLGPAEVEAAAGQCAGVKESAAVGVPHATKGETPILFVVLLPGYQASANLSTAIADKVAEALGKPLRPQEVYFVPDLPRTRNAKIMRRVLRAVHLGQEPGDLSGLENPSALAQIPRASVR